VVVFFFALLLITGVASSVVAAFAAPQLRAGAPVLTDRGERLARSWSRRLSPASRAVMPVLRLVARGIGRALRPLVRSLRPKVAPLTQAISRAVEEGSAPAGLVRRPAVHRDAGAGEEGEEGSPLHAPV
jgi:hypothetical protein